MRISTAIGGVALTIFTILIVISFASMYESTYGSVGSLEVKAKGVEFTSQSVLLFSEISGRNPGNFNEIVSALNNSFLIGPGSTNSTNISFPFNISSLVSKGWPSNNVSLSASMLVFAASFLLKASRNMNISMSLGAPFGNFSIGKLESGSGSGSGNISVNFTDFFSQGLNITKIDVLENSTSIGNIALPVLSFGSNYNLSGTVSLLNGSPHANLTFKAGPIQWTIHNITVVQ